MLTKHFRTRAAAIRLAVDVGWIIDDVFEGWGDLADPQDDDWLGATWAIDQVGQLWRIKFQCIFTHGDDYSWAPAEHIPHPGDA